MVFESGTQVECTKCPWWRALCWTKWEDVPKETPAEECPVLRVLETVPEDNR